MKNNQTLKSFAVRNTITAVIAIIITCAVLGFFSFSEIQFYYSEMSDNKLVATVVSVAENIDGDIFQSFKPGDEILPYYQETLNKLININEKLDFVYIYIFAKSPGVEYGEYSYLMDTDSDGEAIIGEIYEIDDYEPFERAFSGEIVISDIYEDEWGVFISALAPIYNSDGKVISIVGVDLNAEEFQQKISAELVSYILRCIIIAAVILAIFTAMTVLGYKKIKSNLVYVITELRDFSKNIISSVNVFNSQSLSLSEKAEIASESISEMSANLETISSEIEITDNGMHEAANYFSKVSGELSDGAKKVGNLSESIKDIENSGKEITHVIQIINSIAKKTKILAINAQVESARVAGDAGKSFTAVAEEVGSLAYSVENAAKETGNIIDQNKKYINKAVENTEGVRKIISSIEKGINNLNGIVSKVTESSSEQTKNIGEINREVSKIENAVSENAASSEEITSSAHELASMTENLNEHVEIIKNTIANNLKIK